MPRKGGCVTTLYLGRDRLPGAGLSGLHLTRMVVDLPELQDWVTSLDLQSKQPPWGKKSLIGATGVGDSDHTYTLLIVCIKKGFYFTGLGLLYYA